MLKSLSIKNFALIKDLQVDFMNQWSIITGETGAGKSILLGGLSLVLGKRADATLVYDKNKKCVIEAAFNIGNYNLNDFFAQHDLDYDEHTYIRRELLPHGKSRAFVNDTPVNLTVLNSLAVQLIDIHSQHETLQLADSSYQFQVIDAFAGHQEVIDKYKIEFEKYHALRAELKETIDQRAKARSEYDYHLFLLNELEGAALKDGEQDQLEAELEVLTHAEEIKELMVEIIGLANNESYGIIHQLNQVSQNLAKIKGYAETYKKLDERTESILIEFKDIIDDLERENEQLLHDPAQLQKVDERLNLIHDLQKKHVVGSVAELVQLIEHYKQKIEVVELADDRIGEQQELIAKTESRLTKLAQQIHANRKKIIPQLIKELENLLGQLEMKQTKFRIKLIKNDSFFKNGYDQLRFFISSDKGKTFESLSKIASGGEMSRIMLAVKSILSKYSNLPVIVFDEIDTGVSGEVSNSIAETMLEMSRHMQVITITHLPQVAAKGHHHYKVYKKETDEGVSSNIKLLEQDERLVELAEMLGG